MTSLREEWLTVVFLSYSSSFCLLATVSEDNEFVMNILAKHQLFNYKRLSLDNTFLSFTEEVEVLLINSPTVGYYIKKKPDYC